MAPEKYLLNKKSIIESLMNAVEKNESQVIIRTESGKAIQFSYPQILNRSLAFAYHLKMRGIKLHDRVLIVLSTSPEFIFSFYGVLLAGGIPVPVAPPSYGLRDLTYYLLRLKAIIQNSDAGFVAAYKSDYNAFSDKIDLTLKKHISYDDIDFNENVDTDIYMPKPDDICFIQYTSGSTGTTKGVPLSHRNILDNIEGIGMAMKVTDDERGLSWMPLYHDMGLIGGMLLPMHYSFTTMVFMAPMLLLKPIFWLKYISEYKTTISPGNNFAFNICVKKISEEEKSMLDLSCWRVALNGSEPIDINIVEKFYEKFKSVGFKKETMMPCYGLAEATLGVTFSPVDEEPRVIECSGDNLYEGATIKVVDGATDNEKNTVKLISLGTRVHCLDVKIFDDEFNELPEGRIGKIHVKGSSVMKGYFSTKGCSQDGFNDGWFYTGDIGFIYKGDLYFTGREKELVIIRGKNYSAVDIESIIKRIDGVNLNCAAFGYKNPQKGWESLGIVFESKENDNESFESLKTIIQKEIISNFDIRPERIIKVPPKTIPMTLNGKIRRTDCVKFLDDEIN